MQLAIDAADDEPGVALAVEGAVGLSATWQTARNHSRELLPNIDRLLSEAGRTKHDVSAVFVDIGPGGYAALRVGVSIAKGLAHGLGVPIVGVGRLELDAYGVLTDAGERRIVAIHRAGRGELAHAAYRMTARDWREEEPPAITKAATLADFCRAGDIVTGDIDTELADAVVAMDAAVASAHTHRVHALAALGNERLIAGHTDDPRTLVPLYLRAPAIGPQPRE
jgi:tRNA threonylcarbamoyladenosine biosynthesis protein TsaB